MILATRIHSNLLINRSRMAQIHEHHSFQRKRASVKEFEMISLLESLGGSLKSIKTLQQETILNSQTRHIDVLSNLKHPDEQTKHLLTHLTSKTDRLVDFNEILLDLIEISHTEYLTSRQTAKEEK